MNRMMIENHSIEWLEKAISEGNINYFDFSEFNGNEKICDGGFSSVSKSEWKSGGLTVALKSLKVDTEGKTLEVFVKELQLLQRVSFHPKINHFYGVTKDPSDKSYKMVLQFANNGNLREYLSSKFSTLQWEDKFRIAEEIASGLLFLHLNNILHRDLHPKNILVHDNKMMIADFGLSKLVTNDVLDSNSTIDGMPAFIDPQCFKNNTYRRNNKSDIYSFGVILWEISSGRKPFHSLKRIQIAIKIYHGSREEPVKGTPPEYSNLYTRCWDDDPANRPDIEEVHESLNQLIYRPTGLTEDKKMPLRRLLKKAFSEQIINYYDPHVFRDHTKIAEERFGVVYKSEWKEYNLTVVLKCLKINDKYLDENIVKEFIEKLKLLQNNEFHPNIVKFYGLTKDPLDPSSEYYSMVLQFADGGSLRDYLETKSSELNWTRKFLIAKQIVEGLAYLHKNGIVHRDLHSKNILVCEEKMIIAGFGISEYVNEASLSTSIARGMPAYIDPQCLKDPTYQRDMKSDIYSLGVILWEISSGQPPFKTFEVGYAITIHVFKGGREIPVEGTPPKYEQLYKHCWNEDPAKRPDITLVLIILNQLIEV